MLISWKAHQDCLLSRNELVTPHAVVLLDDPPAFLNIAARVTRLVLIAGGKGSLLASEQKGCQCANLIFIKMHVRPAQLFFCHFPLSFFIAVRLGKLFL